MKNEKTTANMFTIKAKLLRGQKTTWIPLGVLFYNAATEAHPESIVIDFKSNPALDAECKAYPRRDDQDPVTPSTTRFNLTVSNRAENGMSYPHPVGVAFHNPPKPGHSENWHILLDSYPHNGKLRGVPHTPTAENAKDQPDTDAELSQAERSAENAA